MKQYQESSRKSFTISNSEKANERQWYLIWNPWFQEGPIYDLKAFMTPNLGEILCGSVYTHLGETTQRNMSSNIFLKKYWWPRNTFFFDRIGSIFSK